jgi:aconitase A
VNANNLVVTSVLSGNRNFEGRINPDVKANYLASPPLVIAYALAGNININISKDPIGKGLNGEAVYLKDIWPTHEEINSVLMSKLTSAMFKQRYANVFEGDKHWQAIKVTEGNSSLGSRIQLISETRLSLKTSMIKNLMRMECFLKMHASLLSLVIQLRQIIFLQRARLKKQVLQELIYGKRREA